MERRAHIASKTLAAGDGGAADPSTAAWILGSLSSGVVAVDEGARLVMLNAGARRTLGCPDGVELLGRDCGEALAAQPAVVAQLLDALRGRESVSRAELVLESVAGASESTIGFTLTPIRDEGGRVRGAAMIFRDLTPFERMDEQERLHDRLAALGEMAAGLAHEIRNPLAGMEVVAGLLKRRLRERPDEQALVTQILGELRAVARTVTDCLEFVRPPSLERGPVDCAVVIEQALGIALRRVPFDGAIERGLADDLPPALGDAEQLRAVLADLVVNAFEAMTPAPEGERPVLRVTAMLRTASDRREVAVSIHDSGPGVAGELRERVFYPFFTTKQRGSGVGLANAQKVAASLGGAIEIVDEPAGAERGACFRLRLPVFEEKPCEDASDPRPAGGAA